MHTCDRCLKKFDRKNDLDRHLNRKTLCKINECDDSLSQIKQLDSVMCEYCKKYFSNQFNLDRHIHNSPNSHCAFLRNLKAAIGPTVINNIEKIEQINNTTNNIIQPTFTKHGQESIDHITREVLLELLNSDNFTTLCSKLMKLLYFNVNVPQNNNWMIAYPKNGKAGVEFNYDTKQFERKSTIDIIDDKFSNMINLLQPLIEQICREDERDNILNTKQRKNINKFFEHVGMLEISKESPEIYAKIHEIAYNYKTIPSANWKEQGLNANHLSIKF